MEMRQSGLSKAENMYSLIAQCESSGLTVKAFCKQYRIATGTYYYWYKKYHCQHLPAAAGNNFELLHLHDSFTAPARLPEGLYAEYKGIRFYQEPSASLLKSLIS